MKLINIYSVFIILALIAPFTFQQINNSDKLTNGQFLQYNPQVELNFIKDLTIIYDDSNFDLQSPEKDTYFQLQIRLVPEDIYEMVYFNTGPLPSFQVQLKEQDNEKVISSQIIQFQQSDSTSAQVVFQYSLKELYVLGIVSNSFMNIELKNLSAYDNIQFNYKLEVSFFSYTMKQDNNNNSVLQQIYYQPITFQDKLEENVFDAPIGTPEKYFENQTSEQLVQRIFYLEFLEQESYQSKFLPFFMPGEFNIYVDTYPLDQEYSTLSSEEIQTKMTEVTQNLPEGLYHDRQIEYIDFIQSDYKGFRATVYIQQNVSKSYTQTQANFYLQPYEVNSIQSATVTGYQQIGTSRNMIQRVLFQTIMYYQMEIGSFQDIALKITSGLGTDHPYNGATLISFDEQEYSNSQIIGTAGDQQYVAVQNVCTNYYKKYLMVALFQYEQGQRYQIHTNSFGKKYEENKGGVNFRELLPKQQFNVTFSDFNKQNTQNQVSNNYFFSAFNTSSSSQQQPSIKLKFDLVNYEDFDLNDQNIWESLGIYTYSYQQTTYMEMFNNVQPAQYASKFISGDNKSVEIDVILQKPFDQDLCVNDCDFLINVRPNPEKLQQLQAESITFNMSYIQGNDNAQQMLKQEDLSIIKKFKKFLE